jgi:hypothetical protein
MFLVTSDLAGIIPVDLSLRSSKCGPGPGKVGHPGFRPQLHHDQKQSVCSRHAGQRILRGHRSKCQLFVNLPKHANSESATCGKVMQCTDADYPIQEHEGHSWRSQSTPFLQQFADADQPIQEHEGHSWRSHGTPFVQTPRRWTTLIPSWPGVRTLALKYACEHLPSHVLCIIYTLHVLYGSIASLQVDHLVFLAFVALFMRNNC